MPDLKLANHPSRAYNSETVLQYIQNNASFKADRPDLLAIKRTLSCLQNYFDEYCREAPAATPRGNMPTPNTSLDR